MVSTRELDNQSMAGRLHILHAIRAALGEDSALTVLRLPNVLTDPSLSRGASTMLKWLWGLVTAPPLPLQCALFANSSDHRRLLDAIPKNTSCIYLDSVRSYSLLVRLRRERPEARVVVDFDDLMSHRMALLLDTHQSLSPGYLTKRLPVFLQRLMVLPPIGRAVVNFERYALVKVEQRTAELADAIVLLSSEDARVLRTQLHGTVRARIEVIAPPGRPLADSRPIEGPVRFAFIGSDALTQNRLTIEYIVGLWSKYNISAPLLLVGLRSSSKPLPNNVISVGYVDNISEIYDGRTVLLSPSLIGGGIKTKVLEAFAHGAPVIGNALTFESMDMADYPLTAAGEQALVDLVADPEANLSAFQQAAAFGMNYLRDFHDPEEFAARWRKVVEPLPSK